jgi:ABC-2 type transport system permease protein
MTTTAEAAPAGRSGTATESRARDSVRVQRISFIRVTHSEWIKLRTLRSTWTMLAAFAAVFVGFGAIAAAVSTGSVSTAQNGGPPIGDSDPLSTVLTGAMFGVLLLGVMGCLAGAREYGSRMITATVAAVPRRWNIVLAKAVALTAVVLPTALVASFAAYGVGMSVLSANGAATVSLSDDGVFLSVVGMAGYLTAIALLGLALGVVLRSVASSIATLIAGVLILPNIAEALLPDSWDTLLQYLPTQAAASFTAVGSTTDATLGSTAGTIVLAIWVVVGLVAAVVSITKRDV